MPRLFEAGYFALLAAASVAVIHAYIFQLPGFKGNPLLDTQCFTQPFTKHYSFLPSAVDRLLCGMNTFFTAHFHTPGGAALTGEFGGIFIASMFICIYESFRPGSRGIFVATLASFFFLLGQVFAAAVCVPVYLALLHLFRKSDAQRTRPKDHYIWSTVLSVLLGFLVPSVIMDASKWSYDSLSIWHPSPLYVLVANLVLPKLLYRSKVAAYPAALPIGLIVLLTLITSAKGHVEMFMSKASWKDIFVLPPWSEANLADLGYAAHMMFCADMIGVGVTTLSQVLFGQPRGGAGGKLLIMAVASVLAGPGAGLILVWAYGELEKQGPVQPGKKLQ